MFDEYNQPVEQLGLFLSEQGSLAEFFMEELPLLSSLHSNREQFAHWFFKDPKQCLDV